jgi:hypothetical protein
MQMLINLIFYLKIPVQTYVKESFRFIIHNRSLQSQMKKKSIFTPLHYVWTSIYRSVLNTVIFRTRQMPKILGSKSSNCYTYRLFMVGIILIKLSRFVKSWGKSIIDWIVFLEHNSIKNIMASIWIVLIRLRNGVGYQFQRH